MDSGETYPMGSTGKAPAHVALTSDGMAVRVIDQTLLPNELSVVEVTDAEACYDAITRLVVRGAPTIGVFAGFAIAMLAQGMAAGRANAFAPGDAKAVQDVLATGRVHAAANSGYWDSPCAPEGLCRFEVMSPAFVSSLQHLSDYLESSRPTAVNLHGACVRMMDTARLVVGKPVAEALEVLRMEAESLMRDEARTCDRISELGLGLLEDGMGIITHCNAGPLATCGHGTALGPILLGHERGMSFRVFADETRPLLQGARITAFELSQAGVDVTLICDNMASIVMRQGWVQACMVGCDRVAANGDVANKIGTSNLAIVAKHYGVPFYVMCPTSTIDYECPTGEDIPIEVRSDDEITTMFYERPMAPAGVACYNPGFDITDNALITAIVTERGICCAPYDESFAAIRQR